jgi:predicted aldo/keto reductase-like oxidoreductase
MNNITKIQVGQNGPFVSKLGLGCMRMSSVWGGATPSEAESIATIHEALDRGINFLNTGDPSSLSVSLRHKQINLNKKSPSFDELLISRVNPRKIELL